jgi:hypothetical protein
MKSYNLLPWIIEHDLQQELDLKITYSKHGRWMFQGKNKDIGFVGFNSWLSNLFSDAITAISKRKDLYLLPELDELEKELLPILDEFSKIPHQGESNITFSYNWNTEEWVVSVKFTNYSVRISTEELETTMRIVIDLYKQQLEARNKQ